MANPEQRKQLGQIMKAMTPDQLKKFDAMSPEQKQETVNQLIMPRMPGRSFSGFSVDPRGIGAPDMTTVEGALDAADRGLIPEFKLPFSPDSAGIKARMIASMSKNPDRQIEMLNANGIRAVKLPSGRVVVINPNNTLSQLEDRDITPGDIADAAGGVFPTMGALVGGVAMSPGVLTSAGGAAAGATIGQAANEGIAKILGAKTGLGEAGGNILGEGLAAGGGTLAMGGMGKGLSNLIKKSGGSIAAPFKKDIVDIGIKSRPMFQAEGADLPVTALTHNRLVSMAYGATKNSAGGARRLADEERAAVEGLDRIIKNFNFKISPTPPSTRFEVGKIDKEAFELAEDVFTAQRDVRFDEISKMIGTELVFPTKAEAYIGQRLKDWGIVSETGKIIREGVIPKTLRTSSDNAFGRLVNIWNGLQKEWFSYDKLKVLRTAVRLAEPGPNEPYATGARSVFRGLEAKLTEDLLENAQRIGLSRDDLALGRKVAETNAWYAKNIALFNGETGKILAKKNPEKIMEALFKPNNDTAIHETREIFNFLGVGDFYMKFLSRQWMEETARKAVVDGELKPNIFARKLHEMGDSTLKAMFPDTFPEVMNIKDAATALSAGIRRGNINPSGTAGTTTLMRAPFHPLEFLSNITAGKWASQALTSDVGKQYLTTGSQSPTLDLIGKTMGAAIDKTGSALQKGAPGAELLKQILSGFTSPSMINQERPTP